MNVFNVMALPCLKITLLLVLLTSPLAWAQAPLKTGDQLPPELWSLPLQVVNHSGAASLSLGEHKDKLIIVDFWASWCSPCISSLAKLDSLQRDFATELMVIPVTYEQGPKALSTFNKRGWRLPTVVADTLLKAYFPHRSIPHQVWIKDGRVFSVPLSAYANREYISRVLKGEKPAMLLKIEDMGFDKTKPLLINGNGGGTDRLLYQSAVSKMIPTNTAGARTYPGQLMLYNLCIADLFQTVFENIIPWTGRHNRVICLLADSLKSRVFMPAYADKDKIESKVTLAGWKNENLYCYSLTVPFQLPRKELMQIAAGDLNRFFGGYLGLNASIEARTVKCLAVVVSDRRILSNHSSPIPDYRNDKNTYFKFTNQPFAQFMEVFQERNKYSPMPIVDQTDYKGNITMEFTGPLERLEMVKKELNRNGFDLVEKDITLQMLVYYPLNHHKL